MNLILLNQFLCYLLVFLCDCERWFAEKLWRIGFSLSQIRTVIHCEGGGPWLFSLRLSFTNALLWSYTTLVLLFWVLRYLYDSPELSAFLSVFLRRSKFNMCPFFFGTVLRKGQKYEVGNDGHTPSHSVALNGNLDEIPAWVWMTPFL